MMGLSTHEFTTAFHSIQGLTVGEQNKNLFQLLKDNVNSEIDFSQIKPVTPLQQIFKADILIFFKNNDELLNLLYEENPAVIDKVLKVEWFIRNIFGKITGKELASNIFPNVSYNTKLKLLNRLALSLNDSSKCDELFYAVKESYGVYLASKLLPGCSTSLIFSTLETSKVELTPKQLLLIIQRNPSIIVEIFEKLDTYNSRINLGEKYKYVFRYLIKTNPSILVDFHGKYTQSFQIGRRGTRKFIVHNKEYFIKHSNKLYKLLKGPEIGKYLSSDFKNVFSDLFPRSLDNLSQDLDEYLSLLNFLPNQEKIDLLLSTFKKHYDSELLDYPEFMVPKILEWMSPSYRDNWIQTHEKPLDVSEELWISSMTTDKSIELIKKKISHTSNIKDRESLISALVQTCKINHDLVALTDVCEYVASKHRNDHSRIKRTFLVTLNESFSLKKFNQEQWNFINSLVQRCVLNNDSSYVCPAFIEEFICFSMKKGLPITEYLKLWIKVAYGQYNILRSEPEFEKHCLQSFYKILPLCFKGEDLEDHYMYFLRSIIDWNKRHRNETISMFAYVDAMNILKEKLAKNRGHMADYTAMECIIHDYEKSSELNLLELLFYNEGARYNVNFEWLVKHHPLDIVTHIEPFMQISLKSYNPIHTMQRMFKNLVDPNLKEKIASICNKERSNATEDCDKMRFAIFILSLVLPNQEFLKIAQEYYPTSLEVDIETSENQIFFKLQQAILPCLRFIQPHAALEPILHFCKGDYMQFAQKSLYCVAQNVAEHRLVEFINNLGERAVSVRKHSIHLATKLLDKTNTFDILKTFMDNEKNASMRKTLFMSAFNYFLRNPDILTWQLVQENMKKVHSEDATAFHNLVLRANKVPQLFFVAYTLFAWESLCKLGLADKIEEDKALVLAAITEECISKLPEDFCRELIQKHLFKCSTTKLEENVCGFTAKYVLYSKNNNLKEIFSIIKDNLKTSRKPVNKFVQELSALFIKNKYASNNIFENFVSLWRNGIEPYNALQEYLCLHFTLIYFNFTEKKQSVAECGKEIAKLFLSLVKKQSADIYTFRDTFETTFKDKFLAYLEGSSEENYMTLIYNIIKCDETHCLGLGLSMLPEKISTIPKMETTYNSIIDMAINNSNTHVQIHLHNYLLKKC